MKFDILAEFKHFLINNRNYNKKALMIEMKNFLQIGGPVNPSEEFNEFLQSYSLSFVRNELFGMQVMSSIPVGSYKNILEIGAGKNLKMAKLLSKNTYNISVIDPALNIKDSTFKKYNIQAIKEPFYCDYFAGRGKGRNIKTFDALIAALPCKATEHVIRQGLDYEKPFQILLCSCGTNRKIDGSIVKGLEKWHEYLKSISNEVKIFEEKTIHYATNLERINTQFLKEANEDYDFFI